MKYILKYDKQERCIKIRKNFFLWRHIPVMNTVRWFMEKHGKISISNKRDDGAILFNIIRNHRGEDNVTYYNTTHDELYFCKDGLREYFGEVPKALYIKILS